jgi:DNA-binding GntR family transcriptional regulator
MFIDQRRGMQTDIAGAATRRENRRQQLPDEVASYVRELILSGTVKPGDFLRMEPIAAAVGVSTTPVREGLLALQSEGFVQLEPRRGFVVAPFTKQDVRDVFWAQAQLSGELAARAAKKANPLQIAKLESLLESYERASSSINTEDMARLGIEFHREVNRAADSPRLALLTASIVAQLPRRFYAAIEGQFTVTHDEHPRLLDALRAGNTRKARSVMEQHILGGADRLIPSLAKRGLWDQDESAT